MSGTYFALSVFWSGLGLMIGLVVGHILCWTHDWRHR